MSFKKDGKLYTAEDSSDDSDVIVTHDRAGELSLTIDSVSLEDAGVYTCNASSRFGHHQLEATVVVQYKPRISPSNVLLVHSWAGAAHNMTCQSFGLPAPTIIWKRRNLELRTNSSYKIYESTDGNSTTSSLEVSVTLADISWIFDEPHYVCVASNKLGSADTKFHLKRATNPDSPKDVNVLEKLADALSVEVVPPAEDGGVPVFGYMIEYAEKTAVHMDSTPAHEGHVHRGDDDEDDEEENVNKIHLKKDDRDIKSIKSLNVTFNGNRTKIHNLKPETSYLLKIKAINQVGAGPELERVLMTDKQSPPGQIEIKSSAQGVDGRKFEVKWEIHNTGGLPILKYEFNYTQVNPSMSVDDSKLSDPSIWKTQMFEVKPGKDTVRTYELSDLSPQTTYVLRVRASNRLGWSKQSSSFKFTTVEAAAVGGNAVVRTASSTRVLAVCTASALLSALLLFDKLATSFLLS